MPIENARDLGGKQQVIIFRNNGESTWMDFVDAKRVVARLPAEWSKTPFAGQTYGSAVDPWRGYVDRQEVKSIAAPLAW